MAEDAYNKFRRRRELTRISGYLSMVMTGTALNWPSPLTEWYTSKDSRIPMTEEEVSWLVSITAVSSGISSVPWSMLADRFGRKAVLLSTGIISIISWSMILFTRSMWVLFLAQLLGGLVVGGAPSVAPIYISEISPPHVRGSYVGHLNTTYFVGQLIVYAVGPHLSFTNYILVCSSVSFLFIATFLYAPESPYFLLSKGKDEKAKDIMLKLRGEESLKELESAKEDKDKKEDQLSELSIWQALKKEDYLKRMICLQILGSVNQLQGVAILSIYVVQFVGGEWVAIVMGIILTLSSFFAAFLADPIGRRPLLIISLLGAAVTMSFITAYFQYGNRLLLYIGVFGFSFITSVGISPFTLTLPSELFPTRLRAFANGLTQFTTGISTFVSLKMFVDINNTLGIKANFINCAFWALVGVVTSLFLPETAKSVISAE